MKTRLPHSCVLAAARQLLPSAGMVRNLACSMLLLAGPVYADAMRHKVCTPDQARQAQAEANQLNDWDSLHRSFKRFAHCDEGAIAEGYSDSVSRILAHNWNHLAAMLRLTVSDREFEAFVIRHIDESMTEDEANLIINNARLHCPQGARQFCNLIADY